jgi:hypothetical protein
MKKPIAPKAMIQLVRDEFKLNAVCSSEFNGRAGGVWIRDNICQASTRFYDYADGTMEENFLNTWLKKRGWFAEPYDAETILFYPV